jgi:sensor c-di-GMP phosphodiesterase-like protein
MHFVGKGGFADQARFRRLRYKRSLGSHCQHAADGYQGQAENGAATWLIQRIGRAVALRGCDRRRGDRFCHRRPKRGAHQPTGISDPELLASFQTRPKTGLDQDNLFAVVRGNGWTALATESREGMLSNLRREQMLLLPVGLFIAAFIVGLVIWASRKRLSPLAELSLAVHKREFIVHYQPIVELKTGICIGAEALVRWRRPDGSLVRPDLFIPLAEESGLIMPITDQVIECVIRDLGETLVADRSLHIAINLAAEDIKTGRILPVVSRMLLGTDIQTNQIWLEATERGFMDIESARATITQAREMGHAIAIDDFGTGYSSLQYLQGLPLDALKIDKSFIDTIGHDTAKGLVMPHIIGMAKELNLFIVAEGVETPEQASYLADHDVEFGQGWHFSKALPMEEFIAFQRERRAKYGTATEILKRVAA